MGFKRLKNLFNNNFANNKELMERFGLNLSGFGINVLLNDDDI